MCRSIIDHGARARAGQSVLGIAREYAQGDASRSAALRTATSVFGAKQEATSDRVAFDERPHKGLHHSPPNRTNVRGGARYNYLRSPRTMRFLEEILDSKHFLGKFAE